jgi:hypothetical protein
MGTGTATTYYDQGGMYIPAVKAIEAHDMILSYVKLRAFDTCGGDV